MGWVQPHARYAYRSVVFDVQNVDVFYLAEEGVFMQAGDRTFIIDKLDRGTNAFEHAFIYQDKGAEGSDTVTAARGSLIENPAGQRPDAASRGRPPPLLQGSGRRHCARPRRSARRRNSRWPIRRWAASPRTSSARAARTSAN